jgi:hypothetical protein
VAEPLAPERYRLQFTVGTKTYAKLQQVQDLLRREIPDGDPAAIFERALDLLLQDIVRRKAAATPTPRPPRTATGGSRHIPAHVKRAVWLRDGGRCGFVTEGGRRCRERAFLEFHHVHPYALGGPASVHNISLRCRVHNAHEAEIVFASNGPSVIREAAAPYVVVKRPLSETRTRFETSSGRSAQPPPTAGAAPALPARCLTFQAPHATLTSTRTDRIDGVRTASAAPLGTRAAGPKEDCSCAERS